MARIPRMELQMRLETELKKTLAETEAKIAQLTKQRDGIQKSIDKHTDHAVHLRSILVAKENERVVQPVESETPSTINFAALPAWANPKSAKPPLNR